MFTQQTKLNFQVLRTSHIMTEQNCFVYFNASAIALNLLSPLNPARENECSIFICFLQSSNDKIKSLKLILHDSNASKSCWTSHNFFLSVDAMFVSCSLAAFIYLLYGLSALIFASFKKISSTATDSNVN